MTMFNDLNSSAFSLNYLTEGVDALDLVVVSQAVVIRNLKN